MPAHQDGRITLGRIAGVFGVKGWLKVFSYTRPKQAIFDYKQWYLSTSIGDKAYRLVSGRSQGKGLVASLQGCDDRDGAAQLVGANITVCAEDLPALAKGDYYWHQLIGLKVVNRDKKEFGVVASMLATGANDVMVVQGDRERLIPYTPEVIDKIDMDDGVVVVNWDADF
ncbi:MAG TPA: ribosome maturation factor RimM [Acidiferrobacteraceae bacterium]|nr:ribosome maturation factor RimM [Acidiferrobacteraceae bacterium]